MKLIALVLLSLIASVGATQFFFNFSDAANYSNKTLVLYAGDSLNATNQNFSVLANSTVFLNFSSTVVYNYSVNFTTPRASLDLYVDRQLQPSEVWNYSNASIGAYLRLECKNIGLQIIEKDVPTGGTYNFSGCGNVNLTCVGQKEIILQNPPQEAYCANASSLLCPTPTVCADTNATTTAVYQQREQPQSLSLLDGVLLIAAGGLGFLVYKRRSSGGVKHD